MNVRRILARLGIIVAEERRGELWARCPNTSHESESTDNWSINQKTGRHRCFSCDFGGSVLGLVSSVLRLGDEWDGGASAAAEWLAGEAEADPKVELPPGITVESVVGVLRPFRLPEGVVVAPVAEWPEAPRRYLLEARGIPGEQADRWGMGYAEEGPLAGRVVLVVRDARGADSNYMARSFLGNVKKKYLYASKAERADFDVVFGEERWPPRSERRVVLTSEGGFKSMALERASGGLPVGALGGSRVRPLHAMKLSTFERVVYVRDSGRAGEEAWQSVRANLGRHVEASCVELPGEHDADSLAKEDVGLLADLLAPHLRHT